MNRSYACPGPMVLRFARYGHASVEIIGIHPFLSELSRTGGFSPGENSTRVPDWVDETVAGWIEQQTALMDAAWGPPDTTRAAVAFVHIPP